MPDTSPFLRTPSTGWVLDSRHGLYLPSPGVVGIDSFCAHIGLAYGKRVVVLVSPGFTYRRSFPLENPSLAFFLDSSDTAEAVADSLARPVPVGSSK
jgi:hypothetical protein